MSMGVAIAPPPRPSWLRYCMYQLVHRIMRKWADIVLMRAKQVIQKVTVNVGMCKKNYFQGRFHYSC